MGSFHPLDVSDWRFGYNEWEFLASSQRMFGGHLCCTYLKTNEYHLKSDGWKMVGR